MKNACMIRLETCPNGETRETLCRSAQMHTPEGEGVYADSIWYQNQWGNAVQRFEFRIIEGPIPNSLLP
jgi:hypothetical protein